jgi:hypothetical protein
MTPLPVKSTAYRAGGSIAAEATMQAWATKELSRVSLDFFDPGSTKYGWGTSSSRKRSAGRVLGAGLLQGVPPTITDPDGTEEGWYPTDDVVLAVGEPRGTTARMPGDKARFSIDVTGPSDLKGVAASDQTLRLLWL